VLAGIALSYDVDFLCVEHSIFMVAGSLLETADQSVSFPFMDVTFSQTVDEEPFTVLLLAPG
jgi:hypothetical protein